MTLEALAKLGASVLRAHRNAGARDVGGDEIEGWLEEFDLVERRTVSEPCDGPYCCCERGDECLYLTEGTSLLVAHLLDGTPAPYPKCNPFRWRPVEAAGQLTALQP